MKIKIYVGIVVLLTGFTAEAQHANIGVGTTTPNDKAILEISSQTKGLFIPRLNQTGRNNIQGLGSSDEGLLIYYQNDRLFNFWNGTSWEKIEKNFTLNQSSNWFTGLSTPTATSPTATDGDLYLNRISGGVYAKQQGNFNLTSVNLTGDKSSKVIKTYVLFSTTSYQVPGNNANGDGFYRIIIFLRGVTGITTGDAMFVSTDTDDLPEPLYVSNTSAYLDVDGTYKMDLIIMNSSTQAQTIPKDFRFNVGFIKK